MQTERCLNAEDFEDAARRSLPGPVFDFFAGGAGDESAVSQNRHAFGRYQFKPRVCTGCGAPDLSASLLGGQLRLPVLLSPVGGLRLAHPDHDVGAARAALAQGAMFCLSSVGNAAIEVVGDIPGPKLFQIYLQKDRAATAAVVERCRRAGFDALCLTVDATAAGNRERDLRNSFRMPADGLMRHPATVLRRLAWWRGQLRPPHFNYPNLGPVRAPERPPAATVAAFIRDRFEPRLRWDDVRWLADLWQGPLAVKGILSDDDAASAVAAGASALIISNHGGRQFEGATAPLDCVAPIRRRVGPDVELIVDGGVRRGVDILKAMALGADACSIGRPYVYALAAHGQAGVTQWLERLRRDLEINTQLAGVERLADLTEPADDPHERGSDPALDRGAETRRLIALGRPELETI